MVQTRYFYYLSLFTKQCLLYVYNDYSLVFMMLLFSYLITVYACDERTALGGGNCGTNAPRVKSLI